jgi:hypothetical protein
MKKHIAILIHGQIRNNILGKGNNTQFIDTFKQSFLNEELLKKYNVNIFLTTDNACPIKLQDYFGSYLKSYVCLDKENIKEPLDIQKYIDKYMYFYNYRKENRVKYPYETAPRAEQLHGMYKRYCSYYLMKEYEIDKHIKYEFIVSIRPDEYFTQSINHLIQLLEQNKHLLVQNDYTYIGRRDIMCHYLNVIFDYGKYMYNDIIHPDEYIDMFSRSPYKYRFLAEKLWPCWLESPEVQIFEHILAYVYKNNIKPSELGYIDELCKLVSNRKENVSLMV